MVVVRQVRKEASGGYVNEQAVPASTEGLGARGWALGIGGGQGCSAVAFWPTLCAGRMWDCRD